MKESFLSLTLVGSVALCVETPGSDVDVVCFTKPAASKGTVGSNLSKIREALQIMMSQSPKTHGLFSLNLIEDARVPILRVSWCLPGNTLAVDVLVDQRRPLDHVLWFQRIGAVPCPSAVTLTGAPAVMHITVVLRCVKWWVKRRKLPPTREGGLPTLAWLLLALHACAPLHESQKSMTQLVSSLAVFFRSYAAFGALNGVLQFRGEEGKSEFAQKPARAQSPWAELSVLDPTLRSGADNRELVPKLLPATQFLINYELGRAAALLPTGFMKGDEQEEMMRQVFEEVPEERNSLPSSSSNRFFGAIVLLGDPAKGVGTLELVKISKVAGHRDWKAPFLHRSDTRSEIHVLMLDINMETGSCQERRRGDMVLCPCHFVCRLNLEKGADRDRRSQMVNAKDLARFQDMKRFLSEIQATHEATADAQRTAGIA